MSDYIHPQSEPEVEGLRPAPLSEFLWRLGTDALASQAKAQAVQASLDAHLRTLVFLTSLRTPLREDEEAQRKLVLNAVRSAVADCYVALEDK